MVTRLHRPLDRTQECLHCRMITFAATVSHRYAAADFRPQLDGSDARNGMSEAQSRHHSDRTTFRHHGRKNLEATAMCIDIGLVAGASAEVQHVLRKAAPCRIERP